MFLATFPTVGPILLEYLELAGKLNHFRVKGIDKINKEDPLVRKAIRAVRRGPTFKTVLYLLYETYK
jgi:hypothetical protein